MGSMCVQPLCMPKGGDVNIIGSKRNNCRCGNSQGGWDSEHGVWASCSMVAWGAGDGEKHVGILRSCDFTSSE